MNHFFHAINKASTVVMAASDQASWLPPWLPPQASTAAQTSDWLFNFINWLCLFFFVAIIVAMVWFCWRFRRHGPDDKMHDSAHHNLPLELTWSVIPALLCVFIFYAGFTGYMDQVSPPADGYQIQIEARQWSWTFTYPNGHKDTELVVPHDTPVVLTMISHDVLHSFFVPEFRTKMDIVPGKYSKVWFTTTMATEPDPDNPNVPVHDGPFHLFCAEYCGTEHSNMRAEVRVLPQAQFEFWLAKVSEDSVLPAEERGRRRVGVLGCGQCHTIDGSPKTGPTWLGLWGKTETLSDGTTQVVDADYIRESILTPKAKIVKGFEGVNMISYQGQVTEENILEIIEYIKTLN